MPRLQERTGCYVRPFAVVSTALWDKYDGHRYVTSVEPLSCEIDAQGRLRRRRLLTMEGKLPLPMRPLLGSHPLYLLEEIVVDRKAESMEVRTTNINFRHIIRSSSVSTYSPDDNGGTNYSISVEVHALPSASKRHISRTNSGRDTGSLESDGGGEKERRGGWLATQIEQFTSNKLLGNVREGEEVLNGIMDGFQADCRGGQRPSSEQPAPCKLLPTNFICGLLRKR